jgi:hypothetical protein
MNLLRISALFFLFCNPLLAMPQSEAISSIIRFKDFEEKSKNFIEILNSGKLWQLGPLFRPDLSPHDAEAEYVSTNVGIADLKNRKINRLTEDNQYVMYGFDALSHNIWIVFYGRMGTQSNLTGVLGSLWQFKSGHWYLIGCGWNLETMREQAEKLEQNGAKEN